MARECLTYDAEVEPLHHEYDIRDDLGQKGDHTLADLEQATDVCGAPVHL